LDDYYKTLGVDKSADEEVIYAAYKALAKKYNPDKGLQDEDKIKIINIAFDILSNKEKRNEYDEKIGYVEKNDNSYINDGDYKYEGEYKDSKYHGQGTLIDSDGDQYVGEFKDGLKHGQGARICNDGEKYEGEWKDGLRNGQGKETWETDGQLYTYEGEFRNSYWHGKGKYVFDLGGKEESIKEGIWEEGKLIKGKETWRNDGGLLNTYEGEYKENMVMHGKGKYVFDLGGKEEHIREGIWEEDELIKGKRTWVDDGELTTLEGEFRNGQLHGKGKYIYDLEGKKETIYEGIWEEGKFIRGKKINNYDILDSAPANSTSQPNDGNWYHEGYFQNYVLIKGKQVMPALEESIGEFKTYTTIGEFNSDGSNKTDFVYEDYSPFLEKEGKFYKGTKKRDGGWNNGFILKKSNGKKSSKVKDGTVYYLKFFEKF